MRLSRDIRQSVPVVGTLDTSAVSFNGPVSLHIYTNKHMDGRQAIYLDPIYLLVTGERADCRYIEKTPHALYMEVENGPVAEW